MVHGGTRKEGLPVSEEERKIVRGALLDSLRGIQDYLLFLKFGTGNNAVPVQDAVAAMLDIARYLDEDRK